MEKIFGKPGESRVRKSELSREGWVEMASPRPTPWHVATPDGTWAISLQLWLNTLVRPERNLRLAKCDYLLIPDNPIDAEKRNEWKTYRTLLRDLPATLTSVTDSIPWPPMPM